MKIEHMHTHTNTYTHHLSSLMRTAEPCCQWPQGVLLLCQARGGLPKLPKYRGAGGNAKEPSNKVKHPGGDVSLGLALLLTQENSPLLPKVP